MVHIFKKELGHYFNNPFGYILVVLASLLTNVFFIRDIYSVGLVSMKPLLLIHYWVLTLLIPALCMRSFAEERKTGTIESLLTLPIKEKDIVFGKMLSVLTIVGVYLILSWVLPLSFSFLSGLYLPEILIGYIGLVGVACMFITFCMYVSLKTSNQVVVFFVSALSLFLLSVFSADLVSSFIPRWLSDYVLFLTPLPQLEIFTKGLLDVRSIFYFISFTAVFLYAVITQLKHRD